MDAQPYEKISSLALLELCVYREARGETFDGKRGVAHVIRNRVYSNVHWWGDDWHSVILHPYQFSSFNVSDPNASVWPVDTDPVWADCGQACIPVFSGIDSDLTAGALYYHDISMGWPHAWGNPADYEQTLAVGRLLFFKPKSLSTNA
jgi:hypothetical protein